MADLKSLQFSQTGEQGVKEKDNGTLHIADVSNDKEFYIFKLVNNTRNGGVFLPSTDDVINPKTGRVERIRLLSGIDTVWMKEQKDLTPEYIKNNTRVLSFARGAKLLRVAANDKTALEFLRLCKHNVKEAKEKTGSIFEFYEYDPAKQQKEQLEKEEFEIEMAIEAKKQPVEAMRKHANYLGINAFDTFGLPKTDEGMRTEYMITAKRYPDRFKKTLGSKEVEISYMVKSAIIDSKIELGGADGNIAWATGGFIARLPARTNPAEYLTDLALTNTKEGRDFLEQLKAVSK